MADIRDVSIVASGKVIGEDAIGAFEAGPRSLAGLSGIQWTTYTPQKFLNTKVTLKGTYVDGDKGPFVNDMVMTHQDGGTASFEA